MKNILPRGFAGLTLALLALSAHAEDYECDDPEGCTAYTGEEGSLRPVNFRRGDLISSEGGWTIHPDDGWTEVED
jgi:hypothetical protein